MSSSGSDEEGKGNDTTATRAEQTTAARVIHTTAKSGPKVSLSESHNRPPPRLALDSCDPRHTKRLMATSVPKISAPDITAIDSIVENKSNPAGPRPPPDENIVRNKEEPPPPPAHISRSASRGASFIQRSASVRQNTNGGGGSAKTGGVSAADREKARRNAAAIKQLQREQAELMKTLSDFKDARKAAVAGANNNSNNNANSNNSGNSGSKTGAESRGAGGRKKQRPVSSSGVNARGGGESPAVPRPPRGGTGTRPSTAGPTTTATDKPTSARARAKARAAGIDP